MVFGRSLSAAERERLKAEVVYWGLLEFQQGRVHTESDLEEEYDRRLLVAERRLGELEPDLPEERGWRAQVSGRSLRDRLASARLVGAGEGARPLITRRGTLKAIGLVGVQVAAALGAVRLGGGAAGAASSDVPPAVQAAGGTNTVDGSDDPDPTRIDQVRLAGINAGRSLYAVFHGATRNPMPGHRGRLFPPPAQPAQPGRLREFSLTIEEKVLEVAAGMKWWGWTFDGAIPGPVIRVTEGDHVRITLQNNGRHPHSLHLHSIHPANQDGVFQVVPAGSRGAYEFTAEPFGVYPYHCHVDPLDQHTARGLYGVMIIDPPKPRPAAREMVMLMNGYDVNFDKQNELYSVNGMPGYYHENPIDLKVGELNRVYLVNMTEFDAVNSFHLHANMFNYYPLGTSLTPAVLTDVVHLGVADRGILEFTYRFPGQYLFHAHQNELTIHGWTGLFNVA